MGRVTCRESAGGEGRAHLSCKIGFRTTLDSSQFQYFNAKESWTCTCAQQVWEGHLQLQRDGEGVAALVPLKVRVLKNLRPTVTRNVTVTTANREG